MKGLKLQNAWIPIALLLSVTGCGLPNNMILQPQSMNKTANTSFSHTVKDKTKPATVKSHSSEVKRTTTAATPKTASPVNHSSTSLGSSTGQNSSSNVQSQIMQHLQKQDQQFTVPAPPSGTIGRIVKEALSQVPYIHWNISSYDVSSNGQAASFTVNYRETKKQTEFVDTHVHQILNSILKPGMTNAYKEFVIHNWIVSHVRYDTSLKNDTAYDALKLGSAVCQGYALLAYRMLTDAGIPTKIETGSAGGDTHMWNEVDLYDKWYQLDITWDDPVGDAPHDVSYTYYNVTNHALAHSHQWNENKLPIADTDFISQLKALINNDPQHAAQYETILNTVGANLPVADTPQMAHQLMQQAIQAKKSSIDFLIKSSQKNSSSFMSQAVRNLVSSGSISFKYTTQIYVRKGQDYCRVHLTFF